MSNIGKKVKLTKDYFEGLGIPGIKNEWTVIEEGERIFVTEHEYGHEAVPFKPGYSRAQCEFIAEEQPALKRFKFSDYTDEQMQHFVREGLIVAGDGTTVITVDTNTGNPGYPYLAVFDNNDENTYTVAGKSLLTRDSDLDLYLKEVPVCEPSTQITIPAEEVLVRFKFSDFTPEEVEQMVADKRIKLKTGEIVTTLHMLTGGIFECRFGDIFKCFTSDGLCTVGYTTELYYVPSNVKEPLLTVDIPVKTPNFPVTAKHLADKNFVWENVINDTNIFTEDGKPVIAVFQGLEGFESRCLYEQPVSIHVRPLVYVAFEEYKFSEERKLKEPSYEEWSKDFFNTLTEKLFGESASILSEAHELIYGERAATYGPVTVNFGRIAERWSQLFGIEVTPEQVGLAMIEVKISRHINSPKRDNLVDIAGYIGCLDKLAKGE